MSLSNQALASTLSLLLTQEYEHLTSLLTLLKQEKEEILENPQILTEIAEKKHKLIQLIEQLTAQHNEVLQHAGFGTDRKGMQDCIDRCDSSALSSQWANLLSSTAECQEQNLKNGILVELSRNRLSQLAEIFHGEGTKASTYDQAGKNNNSQVPSSVSIKA